jgi:hypothetical protein
MDGQGLSLCLGSAKDSDKSQRPESFLDHLKVSAKKCFIASQERLSAFSL